MSERDRMVASAIKQGMDPTIARLCVDLSIHAFNEGFAAIKRVCEGAPEEVQGTVLISALGSMVSMVREVIPDEFAAILATKPGRCDPEEYVIALPQRSAEG